MWKISHAYVIFYKKHFSMWNITLKVVAVSDDRGFSWFQSE